LDERHIAAKPTLAAIYDITAYTEVYESVCLLIIDFKEVFHLISHSYLYAILREYGFSEGFRKQIQRMYGNATSTINKWKQVPTDTDPKFRETRMPTEHVPLYFCFNPLLNALKKKLTGITIGRRGMKTTVIASADDVTIVVVKPEEIPIVQETLKIYKEATGAKINIQKSKALALGSWNTSLQIMDIPYCEEMKVLGLDIQNNTHASAEKSWNVLTSRI